MAMRLTKKYPDAGGYAATEFKAALSDGAGIIDDNSKNFQVTYPGGNFKSPWYSLYDGRKDVGESATMTSLMSSLNDGRQNAFGADVNGNASTTGVPYGWTRDKVDPWTTAHPDWTYVLSPDFRLQTGTVVIVSAAEVFLARAEAADRGWTNENAQTMYQNGIKASFEQWGSTAPNSYFTQADVAFSAPAGSGKNLKQIAIQRYIATYPDGLQGWCEWRRTGYPALTPAPDAVNDSKQIPRRYVYGAGEYGSNEAATKEAASRLPNGDDQDSKFWWDQ
jgi:hypothetical protein